MTAARKSQRGAGAAASFGPTRVLSSSTTDQPLASLSHRDLPDEDRILRMLSGVRAAGLKLTPQRVAIVRTFAGDPTHPTAQEIFDRLQTSMPTMSFATVYNTLDALAGAGLCGSLSLSPGPARFDPNMEPHHHAVCDGCGLVRDVPLPPSEAEHAAIRRLDGAPLLSGFEVRAVEHIYRGLCAACAA